MPGAHFGARLSCGATGQALRRLDGRAGVLDRAARFPDRTTGFATANDSGVRLWEVDHRIGVP